MAERRDKINSPAERRKFEKVIREFNRGDLKSSSGKKVRSKDQAKAIAASEAKRRKG